MSDSAVPETWADARKLILGNAPWILLLVAVERAIEGHFIQAAASLVLCFIALGIAIHWKAFEGLGKREGRRRLAFVFIITGAAILVVGIYLLARAPTVGENASLQTRAAAPSPQVTPASRPKAVITELLAEIGALLDIIQKTLIPLEHNWRVSLGGKNPEQICLGSLDSRSLQDEISGIVTRLRASDNDIQEFLKHNRIDRKIFDPLIGSYSGIEGSTGIPSAVNGLENYGKQIKNLGEKPTCEDVIRADLSRQFHDMTNGLNAFYNWMMQSQERLENFRDALRNEARNAP